MAEMKVKDLMIPVAEYGVISENATLADAQYALEKSHEPYNRTRHSYRAVLVYEDSSHRIVGKIALMDILIALEPKYKHFGNVDLLSRFGFPDEFYEYILEHVEILQKPLDDLCKKAATLKVKDFMQVPNENVYIGENASLNQAIHQLVISHHQSLMVERDGSVVGILRVVDVVEEVGQQMKTCRLDDETV